MIRIRENQGFLRAVELKIIVRVSDLVGYGRELESPLFAFSYVYFGVNSQIRS